MMETACPFSYLYYDDGQDIQDIRSYEETAKTYFRV